MSQKRLLLAGLLREPLGMQLSLMTVLAALLPSQSTNYPLPALFCVEVQAMKELHQELLSPAPKMSPFIVTGTLCTYYIHTLIGYASYFI